MNVPKSKKATKRQRFENSGKRNSDSKSTVNMYFLKNKKPIEKPNIQNAAPLRNRPARGLRTDA